MSTAILPAPSPIKHTILKPANIVAEQEAPNQGTMPSTMPQRSIQAPSQETEFRLKCTECGHVCIYPTPARRRGCFNCHVPTDLIDPDAAMPERDLSKLSLPDVRPAIYDGREAHVGMCVLYFNTRRFRPDQGVMLPARLFARDPLNPDQWELELMLHPAAPQRIIQATYCSPDNPQDCCWTWMPEASEIVELRKEIAALKAAGSSDNSVLYAELDSFRKELNALRKEMAEFKSAHAVHGGAQVAEKGPESAETKPIVSKSHKST